MSTTRYRIVVLEDNRGDFYLIERSLKESGLDCEITSFADGGTALDFINSPASPAPDLMILDLNVPGIDGRSVLEGVRCNPRWSDVPVFAFTASQAPKDMERMKKLGTDCYLIKPVELAGFASFGHRIKAWLENRQLQH